MHELMRVFKLMIIILLEPKVSGEAADKVFKKLGKKRLVRSEASSFNGDV